jgi:Tfp pilus assembly protein PilN
VIRINLLPRAPRRRISGRPLIEIGIPLAALVIVVFLYITLAASVRGRQGQITQTEADIAQLQPEVQAVEDLKRRIEEAKKKEDLLAQLLATQLPASAILTNVRALIPRDVWLTTLSVPDTRSFTMEGFGLSYVAVARLMDNMESANIFAALDLSSAERDRIGATEVVKYSVTGRVVRPGETAEGRR